LNLSKPYRKEFNNIHGKESERDEREIDLMKIFPSFAKVSIVKPLYWVVQVTSE